MKSFFTNLLSPDKRRRRIHRSAESEAAKRNSMDSQTALEIRIDPRRNSPPKNEPQRWAQPAGFFGDSDVGRANYGLASTDGRTAMVGSGNFGVQACSKEDFMQIQTTVMDAFARAEAQFGDDEEFAEEIEGEIDILFDEFEQLKEILVRAQRGDCGTDVERDVVRLKSRIHDVVGRINDREREFAMRKGKNTSSDSSESDDEAGSARGIGTMKLT